MVDSYSCELKKRTPEELQWIFKSVKIPGFSRVAGDRNGGEKEDFGQCLIGQSEFTSITSTCCLDRFNRWWISPRFSHVHRNFKNMST
ncbi:hypothetical protein NECAME_05674 [Necator americanus]|uniref:Uncharacterized protein n=1 Tax=Necator americanus TaxID=51031 RepID=W2SFM0_NECAM|nr:hypothetical protein NECAME_05674 [Necator americanus]ETN68308.1 hypothetical protein NECAME_05674 [Necator americanus]